MSSKYTPEFRAWWKNHRHAGFCEDRFGKAHWNVFPSQAWRIDQYRTEYSIDTDTYYDRAREYTAEEIDQWAKEQQGAEEFAGQHGFTFSAEDNNSLFQKLRKELGLVGRYKEAIDKMTKPVIKVILELNNENDIL